MSLEEIRVAHAGRVGSVLQLAQRLGARRACVESLQARVAFVLISKLYRQMYANTGIATDSARVARSARWARWIGTRRAGGCSSATPMPDLAMPQAALSPNASAISS